MTVRLSIQLRKAITPWIKEYGYTSTQDFVEDAIEHRLLQLKQDLFLQHTKIVKRSLRKYKLTEADILKDFEQTRV
ncbi:MAG: hypothetical protein HYV33_04825 [Candidatus Kerfeldbacteria bacterium]|nr:hypothetical protein [Candidatus Kerfeldbacteria bacterium]